jgi:hypothetical protein
MFVLMVVPSLLVFRLNFQGHLSSFPCMVHAPSILDRPQSIWWKVHIVKLLPGVTSTEIQTFSSVPCCCRSSRNRLTNPDITKRRCNLKHDVRIRSKCFSCMVTSCHCRGNCGMTWSARWPWNCAFWKMEGLEIKQWHGISTLNPSWILYICNTQVWFPATALS